MTQPRLAGVALAALLVIAGFGITLPSVHGNDAPGHAYGNHVKVNFRLASLVGDPTGVLGIEDRSGALVMYAYAHNGELHVTDGNDEQGEPRPSLPVSERWLSTTWHRLDVVLDGGTFTLHLDQHDVITARTFTPATEGTWIDDPRPLPDPRYGEVEWASHRVDASAMAYDETFGNPTTTWEIIEGSGTVELRPNSSGHHIPGRLEIRALSTPGPPPLDANYVRAPLADFGGTYTAEGAISMNTNILAPIGQAVLSGLSGPAEEPRVHWAILQEPDPMADDQPRSPFRWHLVLLDPAGQRHVLSPSWLDTGWHTVHARVDEPAGRLEIAIDGGPIQIFDGLALGTSTHLGTGDIFATPLPFGWGHALYDELAVYEEAGL